MSAARDDVARRLAEHAAAGRIRSWRPPRIVGGHPAPTWSNPVGGPGLELILREAEVLCAALDSAARAAAPIDAPGCRWCGHEEERCDARFNFIDDQTEETL